MPELEPFSGQLTRFHVSPKGEPRTLKIYGRDVSESKQYHFNSLGFRCDEFRADAPFKLFVSGSSYAVGTGLNQEETWPWLFSREMARHHGIDPDELCLMNFAEGGASNDYVARMAISQCHRVRPDLLVAEFVFKNRSEGFLEGSPFQVGSWLLLNWRERRRALREAPAALRDTIRGRLEAIKHYYAWYNDEHGFLNVLKNMLLVQGFCQARHIPYFLIWTEHEQLESTALTENPVLSPLLDVLDRNRLCDFGIADEDIYVDKGADQAHPGPQSQLIYSARLAQFYRSLAPPAA